MFAGRGFLVLAAGGVILSFRAFFVYRTRLY